MIDVALLLVATRRVREAGAEELVRLITEALAPRGCRVREVVEVAADREAIAEQLAFVTDRLHLPVVLTLGGTGLHPEDVAPDATTMVLHRPAPGIAEALRAAVVGQDPLFMLTRGVAGVRGRTLIVNLPDHPAQLERCLSVLVPVLPAAVTRLRHDPDSHQVSLL